MKWRVAAIDMGTNTILLFIGDVDANCSIQPHVEVIRFARLGEGVDQSRRLTPQAVTRACRIMKEYVNIASRWKADCIVAGATSATRDAANREDFLTMVERQTGIRPEVLTGEEEALWSYRGALAHAGFHGMEQQAIQLIDIGGGSTEFVWGYRREPVCSSPVIHRVSLDIGAVRVRDRFFETLPPPEEAWREAAAFVEAQLAMLLPEPLEATTCVGAAGTVAALWLLDSGYPVQDVTRLPVGTLTYSRVRTWLERLRELTPEEVLALRPEVLRGREDIFVAGVLILERWMACSGHEVCLVSPWGLRQGLALRAVWTGRCGHLAEEDTARTTGV